MARPATTVRGLTTTVRASSTMGVAPRPRTRGPESRTDATATATATAGMVRPMPAIAEPSARLRLVCARSRWAERSAAMVSGSSTNSAMITPPTAWCGPAVSTPGRAVAQRGDEEAQAVDASLQVITTAEHGVPGEGGALAAAVDHQGTIRATSMIVTAKARTGQPKGRRSDGRRPRRGAARPGRLRRGPGSPARRPRRAGRAPGEDQQDGREHRHDGRPARRERPGAE